MQWLKTGRYTAFKKSSEHRGSNAHCAQKRCLTRIGPQRITDPVNKCAWLRWAAFVIWLTAFVFAADLVMEFIKGLCY